MSKRVLEQDLERVRCPVEIDPARERVQAPVLRKSDAE
jgi:hypothetical protein